MLKKEKDIVEEIASSIIQMRDLLYANIINYQEYQNFVKNIFKRNKLKYKFKGIIYNGQTEYFHYGYNKQYSVKMPIDEIFINFNKEIF